MKKIFILFTFIACSVTQAGQSQMAVNFLNIGARVKITPTSEALSEEDATLLITLDLKMLAYLQQLFNKKNPGQIIRLDVETAMVLLRHLEASAISMMGDRIPILLDIFDASILRDLDESSQSLWDHVDNFLTSEDKKALLIIYPSLVAALVSVEPRLKLSLIAKDMFENNQDFMKTMRAMKLSPWTMTSALFQIQFGPHYRSPKKKNFLMSALVSVSLLSIGQYLRASPNLSKRCLQLLAAHSRDGQK